MSSLPVKIGLLAAASAVAVVVVARTPTIDARSGTKGGTSPSKRLQPAASPLVDRPKQSGKETIAPDKRTAQPPPSRAGLESRSASEADAGTKQQLFAALRQVDDLSREIAALRFENEQLRWHGGLDRWSHFLQLPDAQVITNPQERRFLRGLLEDGTLPFYLQPGEAVWIVERERDADWSMDSIIRFLGPERVLREAPPTWIEFRKQFTGRDEWVQLFGTEMPE